MVVEMALAASQSLQINCLITNWKYKEKISFIG